MMKMQVIVFKVGEESYGIDVDCIRGIERIMPITRVPTAVPHIKGLINLRGKVIPVMSLRSKFGLPEIENSENTSFLLVSYDDMDVALMVDSVSEIEDVDDEVYFDAPIIVKSAETEYVRGIINNNNGKGLIIMIDHTSLIPVADREQMKELEK